MPIDYSKIEELPNDPPPKIKASKRSVGRPSKTSIQKEIEVEFTAYIGMVALAWSPFDETCAPVLSNQSRDIAEAIAVLLVKHPKALERFRQMTGVGDYMNLIAALMPVITTVRMHHLDPMFAKVDEDDSENPVADIRGSFYDGMGQT
ncbi:MAG: hypothetical protein ACREHG_10195 [Candidatus Saccharimonadales bacterium]